MYAILEDLRYLKQMKKISIIPCILWSCIICTIGLRNLKISKFLMDPTNTTLVPYIIYFYFFSLKEGKTHQLPRVKFSPEIDRKLCRERFCWENEYFVWKYPFSQTPKCSDCRRHTTNDNREMTDARTILVNYFFSHNTGSNTKNALCT